LDDPRVVVKNKSVLHSTIYTLEENLEENLGPMILLEYSELFVKIKFVRVTTVLEQGTAASWPGKLQRWLISLYEAKIARRSHLSEGTAAIPKKETHGAFA
jgi:hypothetical protein